MGKATKAWTERAVVVVFEIDGAYGFRVAGNREACRHWEIPASDFIFRVIVEHTEFGFDEALDYACWIANFKASQLGIPIDVAW